jgi:hypothetical protein
MFLLDNEIRKDGFSVRSLNLSKVSKVFMKIFKKYILSIKKYILSLKKWIRYTFLTSIIFLIIKIFVLNDIDECCSKGYEIGIIFENISIAIISSIIFYFFIVHIKYVKDKININIFLNKEIERIFDNYRVIYREFANKLGINFIDFPSNNNIRNICKNIKEEDQFTIFNINDGKQIDEKHNACKYFYKHFSKIEWSINKIYSFMPFLETDLINIFEEIKDNLFIIENEKNIYFDQIQSLEYWPDELIKLNDHFKLLKTYYNKMIKFI